MKETAVPIAIVSVSTTLRSIEEQILELQQRKKNLTALGREKVTEILSALPRSESLEIATELYWSHPWVGAETIGKALGVSGNRVSQMVGVPSDAPVCSVCSRVVIESKSQHLAREQGDRKRLRHGYRPDPVVCPNCRKELNRASVARYDQERAARAAAVEARIQQAKAMPYADYLATIWWQEKRREVVKKARGQCQLCNNRGVELHVHHKTYANLGSEDWEDLIVLCSDCHARHHEVVSQ